MMLTYLKHQGLKKLNGIFFCKNAVVTDNDQMEYWKNNIFSVISISVIILGCPALIYGAHLFYAAGHVILAIAELTVYLSICLIVTRKKLSVNFRKLFLTIIFYVLSLLLLIFTGTNGAGMVTILFTLILAGSLLEKRQAYLFIIFNVAVFVVLTILLMNNVFKGLSIEGYGLLWFINAGSAQVCGIILVLLINAIYNGLQKQNSRLEESKIMIQKSEMLHRTMIANISDVILITDIQGCILYSSPNMEQKCGWSANDYGDGPFWGKLPQEEQGMVIEQFRLVTEESGAVKVFETKCVTKSGDVKNFEFTAVNMIQDGNIEGILINYHDVTERRMREDKIICLSERDHLTNSYNRDYLDKTILRIDTEKTLPLSVIYGDVNGLKIINDAFGHKTGDQLLISITEILRRCCHENDLIFRVGGDEFLIILPETGDGRAKAVCDMIGLQCEAFNNTISDQLLYLSISLGTCTRDNMGITFDDLVKKAEDSMYKKKILEEKSIHNSILLSMQQVLFEKSQETEEHAARMVHLSKKIGLALGLRNQQLDELELLAKLHDIGKIGIDKKILEKPSKLTDDEWIEMKTHSEIGYRIAKASSAIESIADYIHSHHERWDGNGYPQQLKGENIPLSARIISVVDAYDAMTEDRVYRKGISKLEAIGEIKKNAGTQFDPCIVAVFLQVVEGK